MDLDSYLTTIEPAIELAKRINAPPASVSQWRTRVRKVPAERCPDIERETGGLVTCEELRSDVDWAYIRRSECRRTGPGRRADDREGQ